MKKLKTLLVCLLSFFTIGAFACNQDSLYSVTLKDGNTVVLEMSKEKGASLDNLPQAPAKEGYKFEGWYSDAGLTTSYTADVLSGDLVLYAKYSPLKYYVMFNVAGGEAINAMEVTYNSAYELPTPVKAGYTFMGWTLDGQEFATTGTYSKSATIQVTATWAVNEYTVTFVSASQTVGEVEIAYGAKVPSFTEAQAGYYVEGVYTDDALTTKVASDAVVTGNVTLYVKVLPKTFNITVNEDGGNQVDTTAVFNSQYTVAIPTKEGHDFVRFELADGTVFNATGTYTWTSDITVIAKWQRQADYQKTSILYYDGLTALDSYTQVVDDGSQYSIPASFVPTKKGHTFEGWYVDSNLTTKFVNGTVINPTHDDVDVHLYANFTANEYTIHYNLAGGTVGGFDVIDDEEVVFGSAYSLSTPVRDGYSFEGYTYNGNAFSLTGTFEIDSNITVVATWKSLVADADQAGTELFIQKGNYFKVRESVEDEFTFVFVTGNEYNFANHVVDASKAGASVQALSDSSFKANSEAGLFNLTLTRNDNNGSITYTRKAMVVESVTAFDFGSDYQNSWNGSGSGFRSEFMNQKAEQKLAVGNVNFIPELSIKNVNLATISAKSANLKVTVKVNGVDSYDYSVSDTGVIDFGESCIGQAVTVIIEPLYNLYNEAPLTFELQVNDGVNVYSDSELRTAYANMSVHSINLLRNVTAKVLASETVNGEGIYASNTYTEGSAYSRITSSTNDYVTINGNFFAISGTEADGVTSSLPTVNNDFSYRDWSIPGTSGYYVANVQNGIFNYSNRLGATEGNRMHNGVVTFNDLRISGNNVGDTSRVISVNGKDNVLASSGSFHGIIIRGGTANVNNVTINNTNSALFCDGGQDEISAYTKDDKITQSVHMNLDCVKVYNSFSNSVYTYGITKVDIKNSYFGFSSSASINVDDVALLSGQNISTEITVDTNTVFNNYLTGEEAWFVAYGQNATARALKGYVEPVLNSGALTNNIPMTMFNSEGKFNFVLFMRSAPINEVSEWLSDYNKRPYCKFITNNPMLMALSVDGNMNQYDSASEVTQQDVSTTSTQIMTLYFTLALKA